MKKVLIAYFSTGGTTEKMAQYIAEGIRFNEQEATIKRVSDIKDARQVTDFDGYIFGSPTFSLEIPQKMDLFLSMMKDTGIKGKLGGAFGPYTHEVSYQHDSHAPAQIIEKMRDMLQAEPFELGPLILQEDIVNTTEGMRACQDYGRVFGEKLVA
jgi:flavodoxin